MIANHKGEIPFVVLLIPFLLGIWLGLSFSTISYLYWVVIPLFSLGFVFVLLNIGYKWLRVYKVRWIGGIFSNVILFFVGWFCVIANNELNKPTHFSKHPSQYLEARINSEPVLKNGLVRFTTAVEQQISNNQPQKVTGTLLVTINDSTSRQLKYGDVLLLPGKVTDVDPPFNPGEFNYKKYLAGQNVYQQAYLYKGQYRVLAHDSGKPIIGYALKLRQQLIAKFKLHMRDTSAINVASTLILGYKADLSNDLLQAYSKTGTIHILSVSGGHVAVIYLLLGVLLGFLDRYRRGKIIKAVIIIGLIWYYSLLTGFSPAVCRAAVMISLIIIGKTYSRFINTLNILAVSAFFLLLYNPLYIVDVGFQLSYLSVAGMVVLQPLVRDWLKPKQRWADKLWAACSVSIAAQLITFPLSAFYFHQFPVYFLVSNLFILIPAEIIIILGAFYLALPQIVYVSAILGWLLEKAILIMNSVLIWIEHAPFASIGKIWFTTTEYILAYGIIICLFYFLFNRKIWLLRISLALVFLATLSISFKRFDSISTDSVTFLNLRKHSGLILKHGDRAIILSDLPNTDKNYQYSIQPCLDSTKIADTSIFKLNQNISAPYLIKHGNLIQFDKLKILVCNKSLQDIVLPHQLKVNYVLLTGNPHITVPQLINNYQFDELIIDSNNNDRLITEWVKQATTSLIKYYSLKRNKSYIAQSN